MVNLPKIVLANYQGQIRISKGGFFLIVDTAQKVQKMVTNFHF